MSRPRGRPGGRLTRVRGALLPALCLVLVLPTRPSAHEVPADVTVQLYVKPAGRTLTLLVRVPVASMRDVELPLRGPGYLEIEAAQALLGDAAALWIADYVDLYEDDRPLGAERVRAARLSLPSDRSFGSFQGAYAHVTGPPLSRDTELYWEQALLDVLLDVPITSDSARFSLDPRLAHLGVETVSVVHFVTASGAERVFRYEGDPGLIRLDPRWHQAALRFVRLGFLHILDGLDHLLFILCLVLPFRRLLGLVPIVTAFTVAHSITLAGAVLGMAPTALWFTPLVETLIAGSVVYMAFENILGARLHRRWLVAFGFGLVHGFGFSFVLAESLQFAGVHLATSLFAFNVGVELGQLLVLILAVPVLEWLFRRGVKERPGVIVLSALIAHTAWHWMTERGGQLSLYELKLPPLDTAFAAAFLRWVMLLLICAGAVWVLEAAYRRFSWATDRATKA